MAAPHPHWGFSMGVKDFVVSRVVKKLGLQDARRLLDLTMRLGQPSEHPLPPDLMPLLAREAARGVLNNQFFQSNRDWVKPYWAERQFDPMDDAFVPRIISVGLNCTHRNWTAIGTTDGKIEPVVDPRGLLTPWLDGWSLDTWALTKTVSLYPSRAAEARQFNLGAAAIVKTVTESDTLLLETESFATRLRGSEIVLHRARVQNLADGPAAVRLFFSVRPYNPEGMVPIHELRFVEGGMLTVEGRVGLIATTTPDRVVCRDFRHGDCALDVSNSDDVRQAQCATGLASGFIEYNFEIGPGEVDERVVVLPIGGADPSPKTLVEFRRFDYRDQRTREKSRWEEIARTGMTIDVPDPNVQKAFDLNKVYLRLLDDGHAIHPGPLTYHHFWFRDSAFLVTTLDKMGYTQSARDKLVDYPSKQQKDGFFLSQEGEWDSNGQAIWTLVEHVRMTGDKEFLDSVFPAISAAAYWIENKRKTTKTGLDPHAGLLPPGASAEHLGPNDYFYWDDFWGLAGLREAAWAAQTLGRRTEWLDFESFETAFRKDILTSLSAVEKRLGKPILTASPYRRMDSGAIGSICSVYPLGLFDAHDEMVTNTLAALRDRCFVRGGFFQDMVHSGINVYLTLHIAQCYLARRDPFAWELAVNLLNLAQPTLTWPEAIHARTLGGCMGDGHHGWAVADWLMFVRNALIKEDADVLSLTSVLPASWFDWGRHIGVDHAPTHFGNVSFAVEGKRDEVVLRVNAQFESAPRRLAWTLPFSVMEALVDGKGVTVNDRTVIAPGGVHEIRVRRP